MIKTAAVFSSNMVLQRNKNVRIFGVCANVDYITVTVEELCVSVRAFIRDGRWEAILPPMAACDGLTVTVASENEKIILDNVSVGEVWLAGGQSNMEFELRNEANGRETLARCSKERVRFYYTPKCAVTGEKLDEAEKNSGWSLPDENNAQCWSAVGYYFAEELSRRLGVTVGVIGCNWGGTSASAWMDREYLRQDSRIKSYIDEYDSAIEGKTSEEMTAEYDEYTAYHTAWEKRMQQCYAENPDIKWDEVLEICGENRYPGPVGCTNPMRPCGLYETMISRVAPYTIGGFIYYQGESDDHRPEAYDVLLRNLIENWRRVWKDDTLPFILVQLPMFKYAADPDTSSWSLIRDNQMKVFRTVKNTGIAVALDCGEFNEIHPKEKKRVAHRLYLQAMYHVYGDKDEMKAFPPVYRSYEICGNMMKIEFDYCEGFRLNGELKGFELAGEDGVFFEAEARISGNCILVTSDDVEYPVKARFKWRNYAEVELFGRNGLPVPPFRTE